MTPITIEATMNAPIEKVWERWNEPSHIMQWAFASDDWEAPAAFNDLRVGGRFTTTMAAKDGSASFDFSGVYTEVIPNEVIAYTMDDGRKVRVEFTRMDDVIKVAETFDPENEHPEEMQRAGWQAILDNFTRYVERS